MLIRDVLYIPAIGGFFNDDLAAVRAGAVRDGQWYQGRAITPGFSAIRQPARAVGIGLRLSDGTVAWGDAVSVQYAGAGGRDPVFELSPGLARLVRGQLCGLEVDRFRPALETATLALTAHHDGPTTALRYGLSQALLAAAAASSNRTMCEVICDEYGLPLPDSPVPIYGQSGDDLAGSADKMILKRVDALPHGLINNREKFGVEGKTLIERIAWVAARIDRIAATGPEYRPILHFDVYGTAGHEFGQDIGRVADFLTDAERAAGPYRLRVESPLDLGDRERQITGMRALRDELRRREVGVEIVADEWCNTLEDIEAFIAAEACDMVQIKMPDLGEIEQSILAVLRCRESGMGALLGGSCTETEVSARVSVHVALATRPNVQLAKPGMGVDEGLMIVANEQARVLATLAAARETSEGEAAWPSRT